MLRVVIDTSVWISAFINPEGPPAQVIAAFLQGRFVPVFSQPILREIWDIAYRPRIRHRRRYTDAQVAVALGKLREGGTEVFPPGTLRLCRDPKDDIILETAVEGNADLVVSRDADMTRDLDLIRQLRAFGVDVLTVAQFLQRLDETTP